MPGLFNTVAFGGKRGSIVWGSSGHDAAVLGRWSVARDENFRWRLSARVERANTFTLRQVPLLFQAPRYAKPAGLWCFPVLPKSLLLDGTSLTADLGPPEGR